MDLTDEIRKKAETLAGRELREQEAALLGEMCAAAAQELEQRLRQGVKPEDIQSAFVSAAGVLALSLYIQVASAGEEETNLKLGDVSVQRRGAGTARVSASTLRKQAEAMLAAYLEDQGFFFREVRG